MLTLGLYGVALAALLFSRRTLGDYFTPLAIYIFFWCFALGTFHLGWVSFDALGREVWVVILVSFASFVAGGLVPTFYAWSRPAAFRSASSGLNAIRRHRLEQALAVLFALGIFGFAVQMVHLHLEVGLASFITEPQRVRDLHSNVKYLGFFDILNLANFVMGVVYLALFPRPKLWILAMLAWALLTTFVSTDRTRFFYTVIWAFYAAVYTRQRVNLTPKMIMGGVLTALALVGFFLLIAKIYVKQAFDDNMEYINLPQEYALAVDPYIYLTGSFPVLQAFLEDKSERMYGKYTFEPMVKLIEVIYPDLSRAEIVGKFYRVPVELNAGTYLQPFIIDWGPMGMIICPFLIGLLGMWVYIKMRAEKTLFMVYFTAILSFCVTISIFVNHFTQTATWFFVLVGYLTHRYCAVRPGESGSPVRMGVG